MLKFGKKIESSFATPFKPQKLNDSIVGVYMGEEEIPAVNGGKPFTSWRFREVDPETGEIAKDAKVWGVSGAFLTSIMDQVPVGAICKVIYKGSKKTAKGNDSKQWEVLPAEGVALLDPYV